MKPFSQPEHVEILNAVFTPMNEDETVNFGRIPAIFEHCIQTGANGIFLNGSTGECMSLSLDERMGLAKAWLGYREKTSRSDFKIFVHVGSCNLLESAQMARQAQQLGADGVAMVAPFYFRPETLNDLVKQCEFVAQAAASTPFYFYNIPVFTGVNFPMAKFMKLAIERIPNFAGLKNSTPSLVDYQYCLKMANKTYSMYWGIDEAFMMLYTAGNRHYVGSTYNYMSPIYHSMIDSNAAGDFSTVLKLEKEALAIYQAQEPLNGISAGKEMMRLIGVDCGPVRRPLPAVTEQEATGLLQRLMETNFFQINNINKSAHVA